MIAYLDTNVALWLASGRSRQLSRAAEKMVQRASLLISPMVVLELEYLYDLRRTRLRSREIQVKLEGEVGVTVCQLTFAEVATVALDEGWTRDPFDRLIVANAKANGFASLISADEEFAMHYVRTVW